MIRVIEASREAVERPFRRWKVETPADALALLRMLVAREPRLVDGLRRALSAVAWSYKVGHEALLAAGAEALARQVLWLIEPQRKLMTLREPIGGESPVDHDPSWKPIVEEEGDGVSITFELYEKDDSSAWEFRSELIDEDHTDGFSFESELIEEFEQELFEITAEVIEDHGPDEAEIVVSLEDDQVDEFEWATDITESSPDAPSPPTTDPNPGQHRAA